MKEVDMGCSCSGSGGRKDSLVTRFLLMMWFCQRLRALTFGLVCSWVWSSCGEAAASRSEAIAAPLKNGGLPHPVREQSAVSCEDRMEWMSQWREGKAGGWWGGLFGLGIPEELSWALGEQSPSSFHAQSHRPRVRWATAWMEVWIWHHF